MNGGPQPPRHHLVWLAPGWPDDAMRGSVAPDLLAEVERWIALGRPLVAARPDPGAGEGEGEGEGVALGLALPGRRRVALRVAPSAVERVAPPLSLRDAIASAPARWTARLSGLEAEARAAGLGLAVYGSLAWQHLSGEPYLTEDSDVDLLAPARSPAELRAALRLLEGHAGDRDPALDGELLLEGGSAVAWRELLSGATRVLVKSAAAVSLVPTRTLLGAAVVRRSAAPGPRSG
jgi:phosphoribosyl-dephospho-CoA transferase